MASLRKNSRLRSNGIIEKKSLQEIKKVIYSRSGDTVQQRLPHKRVIHSGCGDTVFTAKKTCMKARCLRKKKKAFSSIPPKSS